MGRPEEITVTIEPGDMLNEEAGEIVDLKGKTVPDHRKEPKIIGAPVVKDTPPQETLDSRSKVAAAEVETTAHGEAVTVREHVRSKPQKKDEPEVRIRTMTREQRETWNRVRRAEEE
jgi:hypothetical protein